MGAAAAAGLGQAASPDSGLPSRAEARGSTPTTSGGPAAFSAGFRATEATAATWLLSGLPA